MRTLKTRHLVYGMPEFDLSKKSRQPHQQEIILAQAAQHRLIDGNIEQGAQFQLQLPILPEATFRLDTEAGGPAVPVDHGAGQYFRALRVVE